MKHGIHVGTMLIQDRTHMPATLVLTTNRCLADWSQIIGSTSAQLGREIEAAGWTFFYMAGEIRTRAFGFNDQSRAARSLGHLIRAVKLENCNCLEITEVRQRSFFGLPYTSLVAHARHIQMSRSFCEVSSPPASDALRSRERSSDQSGGVEKAEDESMATVNHRPSVSVSPAEAVDRIHAADFANEAKFHAGDNIILAEGPHKDLLGIFLGPESEVEWAAIKEADGTVSSHPVGWMRNHRGLLSYHVLTGRENTQRAQS